MRNKEGPDTFRNSKLDDDLHIITGRGHSYFKVGQSIN